MEYIVIISFKSTTNTVFKEWKTCLTQLCNKNTLTTHNATTNVQCSWNTLSLKSRDALHMHNNIKMYFFNLHIKIK